MESEWEKNRELKGINRRNVIGEMASSRFPAGIKRAKMTVMAFVTSE